MEITESWLEEVSDEEGLTKGQEYLLWRWCITEPFVGKSIPDDVAKFIGYCRGYRGIPEHVRQFKGWT